MKTNNKTNWKQGMEITPLTFIEADNYQQFHHEINRKLITQRSYGLLPKVKFDIKCDIIDSDLHILEIFCEAVTKNSELIQLSEEHKVTLPSLPSGTYYFAIKIGEPSCGEKSGVPYIQVKYDYEVKSLVELSNGVFFPIIKLNNENSYWEQMEYIPPCFALSSNRLLLTKYDEIRKLINEIFDSIDKGKREFAPYLTYTLSLLILELNNFGNEEAPLGLIILLKKILKTLLLCGQDSEKIVEKFLQYEYEHDDILKMLEQALIILKYFNDYFHEEEVVPPEPPPPVIIEDLLEI